jgi:hypothetical protein
MQRPVPDDSAGVQDGAIHEKSFGGANKLMPPASTEVAA